jgi:hypothetical protein
MGLCYEEIKLIEAEKQKEATANATSSDENSTIVGHHISDWTHIKRELMMWYKVLGQTTPATSTSGY